jgi:hypothetical protein
MTNASSGEFTSLCLEPHRGPAQVVWQELAPHISRHQLTFRRPRRISKGVHNQAQHPNPCHIVRWIPPILDCCKLGQAAIASPVSTFHLHLEAVRRCQPQSYLTKKHVIWAMVGEKTCRVRAFFVDPVISAAPVSFSWDVLRFFAMLKTHNKATFLNPSIIEEHHQLHAILFHCRHDDRGTVPWIEARARK